MRTRRARCGLIICITASLMAVACTHNEHDEGDSIPTQTSPADASAPQSVDRGRIVADGPVFKSMDEVWDYSEGMVIGRIKESIGVRESDQDESGTKWSLFEFEVLDPLGMSISNDVVVVDFDRKGQEVEAMQPPLSEGMYGLFALGTGDLDGARSFPEFGKTYHVVEYFAEGSDGEFYDPEKLISDIPSIRDLKASIMSENEKRSQR